jgi:hypothetical protein
LIAVIVSQIAGQSRQKYVCGGRFAGRQRARFFGRCQQRGAARDKPSLASNTFPTKSALLVEQVGKVELTINLKAAKALVLLSLLAVPTSARKGR